MHEEWSATWQDPVFIAGEPSSLVERFADHLPAGCSVLDIGVGQGRHALYLASRGFAVTGIDLRAEALDEAQARATARGLQLDLVQGDFIDYVPRNGRFDAVLGFGLLQTLSRRQGASLLHRLRAWTRRDGLAFLTAWHVDDPSYSELSASWERFGLHSFRGPQDQVRTFLARGEIRDLMLGWGVLHHWEGLGPEHRHGDGPLERHGEVEFVAIRSG
jgi:2-polyprenyl-3-methyl-5-hydroxy-6-metoxy-1,4-benzoquinol methylase